jgi:hypothetical protein
MGAIPRIVALPLWLRATVVILAGILLSVWITGETTRELDERHMLVEMRGGVQRSAELLAGLLSESVVTGDSVAAGAIIKQYVSTWQQVTYVHIMLPDGNMFTDWQQRPVKFGAGILKFEEPIRFGTQTFGTLSLYVDLRAALAAIHEHVVRAQRREALTLLALVLVVTAAASYAALQPFRELAERATGLLERQGALRAAGEQDEAQRIGAALDLLQRLAGRKSPEK